MSAAVDYYKQELPFRPDQVLAELSQRHLHHFVRQAWHIVEPGRAFVDNWHIGAECEHLQAVMDGEIQDLVINVPPRTSKSTVVSVMFPVWGWIRNPALQWLCVSYGQELSTRDAVKSRRILDSTWFAAQQRLWKTDIKLTSDQNQKHRYQNTQTGYRLATSVKGKATGEGGDIILLDDLHNMLEAESEAKRGEVLTFVDEVLPTRINDPQTGSTVLVMQRVHDEDAAGHMLEQPDAVHLNLPMEYEGRCVVELPHRCSQAVSVEDGVEPPEPGTPIGFTDPRTEQGELLCPDRFPLEVVRKLETKLGSYAHAGHLQQRPTPREGGMFKPLRFKLEKALPHGVVILRMVRSWDKAATKGAGCWTVGVLMYELEENPIATYWIVDVIREQLATDEREQLIQQTATLDGVDVEIVMEQEGGSAGVDSISHSIRGLDGFYAEGETATGSKELRAGPWSSQVNVGNVALINGPWNRKYKTEHGRFPNSKDKDQVDASSQAHKRLSGGTGVQVFL